MRPEEKRGASESATEGVRRLVKVKRSKGQGRSTVVGLAGYNAQDRQEAPTGRLRLLEGRWNAGTALERVAGHTQRPTTVLRVPRGA